MTDSQRLLADYVQTGSDRAFRDLVTRYVDLVYSTALRLVDGDAHRAQDVTQTVFVDLTRTARTLSAGVLLGGWLHRHTCFVAAHVMRGERRRQTRERQAMEMNALQTTPEPDFNRLAPLLDEAINELSEADRTAILLRFFEQHDFRAIGQALASNEDAARMRVNRALEKLQELLKRRGLTSSAAALAVVLSANAVQAAPVGLALTVATAAALTGTTLATTATLTATKAIAMTTLQKTIIAATVAILAGAGIYEARQASQLCTHVQTLQQQQAPLAEQIQTLQSERDDATNRLADLAAENTRMKSNPERNEILRLRGQVAAASRAAADTAAKTQALGDGSGQSEGERDQRNQTRANLDTFFKLTNLSREKADQYVDLEVEMKRRQSERMKALSGGTLSVADAARQRDQDKQAQEDQRRALLGPDGSAVLDSIADGMRDGVAKRLTSAVQAGMVNSPLTQEQSDRMQSAIKAEVAANTMDDTDLFRPVDEWAQMVTERQQHVVQAASEFLTPAQQETLQFLEKANLAQMLQQREQRRKALGINQ